MGDATAGMLNDFIAGPYNILARAKLDLPGPGQVRQQLADVDREGRKRCNRFQDWDDAVLAHRVETDCAGRNRDGMAILEPQNNPLAHGWCR